MVKGFLSKLRGEQTPAAPLLPVTIVSGLPRSGTSMMMKMLEAGGIAPLTDELRAADRDNPKGYYEFERVKQLDKGDTAWLPLARGKAVKVISFLLHHLPPGETYKVVFLRRNIDEILASQRKMLINRGEDPNAMDDAQVAAMFEKHLQHVDLWQQRQPNIDLIYIHYSDVMSEPQTAAARLQRFLGRDLDEQRMAETVDPALYRNRRAAVGAA